MRNVRRQIITFPWVDVPNLQYDGKVPESGENHLSGIDQGSNMKYQACAIIENHQASFTAKKLLSTFTKDYIQPFQLKSTTE